MPSFASKEDQRKSAADQAQVETTLVLACQRGDRAAHRQLYELCISRVWRLVSRLVDPQDAWDVVQQVFLQVIRSIGQFSALSSFETWLYRVTVNEALQHERRRRRQQCLPLSTDPPDRHTDHQQAAQLKDLLATALYGLEPELRAVFCLREVEGRSYAEIAAILQIPDGTVASRLSRARDVLREKLADEGREF